MGLLDRFRRRPTTDCDWCSTAFEHPPIESGGLAYCSQECIDAANAPPVEAEVRSVHAKRAMTAEHALDALRNQDREVDRLEARLKALEAPGRIPPGAEAELNKIEFEFWAELDEVRAFVATAGLSVDEYDEKRSMSQFNSIELVQRKDRDIGVGLGGIHARTDLSVGVEFADKNLARMRQAVVVLVEAVLEADELANGGDGP